MAFENPNARVKQTPDGPVEHVDPLADFGELMFSKVGLGLVVGADLFVNGGDLLGAGFELGGELLDGAGNVLPGSGAA